MATKREVKSSAFHDTYTYYTWNMSFDTIGGSGEVFQKATLLSLSSDLPKETKSRQKKKERSSKPKSTGQKV